MVRRHSRVATFSHPFAVPLITTAICLRANQHPSFVDDWPCFEDAISLTSGIKHQCRLLVLEARVCAKYQPIHLHHSWHIVRLLHRNPDLGAVRAVEAREGGTDHMVHPRQAEHADPAASTLPLACMGELRAPSSPASLHARDGVCEWPTAYAAGGAEHDRPRLDRRTGRGRGCGRCERGEGAVKRRGSPSGFVREKNVAFEASERGAREDDTVKHYDADGACLLSLRASWCADSCASSDEGGVIYWHWHYCDCDRASDVRGAWVGCLRASALYSIRISVHQDGRVWASIYRICNFFYNSRSASHWPR